MSSPLRQLLVHFDAARSAPLRLAAARQIGQEHGARVTALYATVPVYLDLPYAPELAPTVAASLIQIDDERRDAARRAFDDTLRTPGPVAGWAETSEVPLAGAFAQQALHADLLVLGQHDGADPASVAVPADFVESVLLASGRPGLVIPYAGWPQEIGETAVIAWKETREAARAVTAAIPLLQRARQVHVLTWDQEQAAEVKGQGLDLAGWLALHGIETSWHRGGPEPGDLAERLLSRAFDLGADLLVMGCYGHSRAREWVLGGTSRGVLRGMTLPVLMAH